MLSKKLFEDIDNYYFPEGLMDAVRTAEYLQMPLLLTGLPGTGKTKAGEAIAEVLEKAYGKKVVYRDFNTKSVSIYKDLLYTYNHLEHFLDVQLKKEEPTEKYITYNALGLAIMDENYSLVLIDEIDKAPRDFPNDLLDTMENITMEVHELGKTGKDKIIYRHEKKPFVVITSNSEKSLPDAFLRRCIYYHIDFPTDITLQKILLKHITQKEKIIENFQVIENWFSAVREKFYRKQPGTAELIAWLKLLIDNKFPLEKLNFGSLEGLTGQQKNVLRMSFSVLAKTKEDFDTIHNMHH